MVDFSHGAIKFLVMIDLSDHGTSVFIYLLPCYDLPYFYDL